MMVGKCLICMEDDKKVGLTDELCPKWADFSLKKKKKKNLSTLTNLVMSGMFPEVTVLQFEKVRLFILRFNTVFQHSLV